MGNVIRTIDMHTQNVWETNIRILNALRDVFCDHDAWIHEGTWEEFTRPGGIYYQIPDTDPDAFDANEELEGVISEWESELYEFHAILAYPDGESGMYWIEYDSIDN